MSGRMWFLALILVAGLSAVGWAVRSGQLPPADFSFGNESEIASVDPALTTGIPEARIVYSLFEGLCRPRPDNNLPEPGTAEKWWSSDAGLFSTLHLRESRVLATGETVTAHYFYDSLRRLLDPLTCSRYAYQ